MSEHDNGKKGQGAAVVVGKMENLVAVTASGSDRIFLTFDVALSYGNMSYTRSFTTWIPASKIQRAVVLPPDFTSRG